MAELEVAEGDRELGKEEEVRQDLDHSYMDTPTLWSRGEGREAGPRVLASGRVVSLSLRVFVLWCDLYFLCPHCPQSSPFLSPVVEFEASNTSRLPRLSVSAWKVATSHTSTGIDYI